MKFFFVTLIALVILLTFATLSITTATTTTTTIPTIFHPNQDQTILSNDPIEPIEIPTTITPISINSTQAYFVVSTVIKITCPIPQPDPDPPTPDGGGDDVVPDEGNFFTNSQINADPILCALTSFSFNPPPQPEPQPDPDPPVPPDPFTIEAFDVNGDNDPEPQPVVLTTILPITNIDLTLFSSSTTTPLMSTPLRLPVTANATSTALAFPQLQDGSELYVTMMVSFDITKTRFILTDFPQFIATFTLSDTKNPPTTLDYTLTLNIPLQTPLGQMKAIGEYRHYNILTSQPQNNTQDNDNNNNEIFIQGLLNNNNDNDIIQRQSSIEQYNNDNNFDPLADQRAVNIHDIIPLMSIFNITLPHLSEEDDYTYKSLRVSTTGFMHFELVDYIGQVLRQQDITCFVNNIKVNPLIQFDQGPGRTTTIEFELPPVLIDYFVLTSSTTGSSPLMISFDCPYQLVLMPRYPTIEITTPHIAVFPYAITTELIVTKKSQLTQSVLATTTTLIIPTNIFAMLQNSQYTRPLSQLTIVDGYYDSTMLYCQLTIAHEWNRSFGYQDLFGVFTSTQLPVGGSMIIERRTTQIDHSRQATPSTSPVTLALIENQAEDAKLPLPLGEGSWSSGNVPLYADNVNKKAKDSGISLYASIPLKADMVRKLNEGKMNPMAQCGFSYMQQYGIKTHYSTSNNNNNNNNVKSNTPAQAVQKNVEPIAVTSNNNNNNLDDEDLETPSIFIPASLNSSNRKNVKAPITGTTEIPTALNSYNIATVSQVPYIPPVAASMSLNVSDARGSVEFDLYLNDFTSPIDNGTVVMSFPSRSYVFSGDLLCNFNEVKIRGIGFNPITDQLEHHSSSNSDVNGQNDDINLRQGTDKGWFDIKFDLLNMQTTFPKGSKIHIECPDTVLVPAWNNYYYVKATVPIRVAIYKPATALTSLDNDDKMMLLDIPSSTNLVASTSTIQELPATKSYIVIAIVLSIIAFFFAVTLLLTKLCDRLIDRLHKHKVHVYIKTDNREENLFLSNNNNNNQFQSGYNNNNSGPRHNIMSSEANSNYSTQNFLTSSNVNYQLLDGSGTNSISSSGGTH